MYTYTYMNITTYIRKEDEHLWNLIENKAQWIHEQLNKLTPTPAHTTAKPLSATKKVPFIQWITEPVYEEVLWQSLSKGSRKNHCCIRPCTQTKRDDQQ
jgi:hypothetical protein